MSPRELVWRAARAARTATGLRCALHQTDELMLHSPSVDWDALLDAFRRGGRPTLLDADRAGIISARWPAEVRALVAEAERHLGGERRYFGYPVVHVGPITDWNHDPVSGHQWPLVPSDKIDYRTSDADPKWIWELNRLQHLPILAQAWLFTGRDSYASAALEELDSWIEQNPVGYGMAWRVPFESGIRAISVAVALQGLRGSAHLSAARYRRAVRMLHASARHCRLEQSRFSSANNHLVGELAGLATVCLLLPELSAATSMLDAAVAALAQEADRQILPDGAGAEQAVSYQMFTVELLALVAILLSRNGVRVPREMTSALARSGRYLASIVGADDPDPRYGDDDDGFAIRLGPELKRTVRDHLAIVAAVLPDAGFACWGTTNLTAAWFRHSLATELGSGDFGTRDLAAGSCYAPDGGLVVLRSKKRRLTMDVGPLGYLSIAAHGHADALAVTLSVGGRELIVDAGAASYYGNPAWRTVHRGTRAHATVSVDGADQSVMGGAFYWRRHAATSVRSVDLMNGIVDAQHDGYHRLYDPVTHRRWIIAPPDENVVVVVDLLDAEATHDIVVSWPLHPDLEATAMGTGHLVTCNGSPVMQLAYAATATVECDQVRGDADSQLGWWSDRLEWRRPAWLLGARSRATGPLAFLTLLNVGISAEISAPRMERDGSALVAGWQEGDRRRVLRIDVDCVGSVEFSDPYAMRMVTRS